MALNESLSDRYAAESIELLYLRVSMMSGGPPFFFTMTFDEAAIMVSHSDALMIVRRKIDWSDRSLNIENSNNKKRKNKTDPQIVKKHKDLRVDQIFSAVTSGGRIYWEFKAG